MTHRFRLYGTTSGAGPPSARRLSRCARIASMFSMPFQSPSAPRNSRWTTRPPGCDDGSPSLASSGVTQKLTFTAAGSAWTRIPSFVGALSYL